MKTDDWGHWEGEEGKQGSRRSVTPPAESRGRNLQLTLEIYRNVIPCTSVHKRKPTFSSPQKYDPWLRGADFWFATITINVRQADFINRTPDLRLDCRVFSNPKPGLQLGSVLVQMERRCLIPPAPRQTLPYSTSRMNGKLLKKGEGLYYSCSSLVSRSTRGCCLTHPLSRSGSSFTC
jgi:hypothetical protein